MKSRSIIVLSALLLLSACGLEIDTEEPTRAESTRPEREAAGAVDSESAAASGDVITIKSADGEKLATLTLAGERVRIVYVQDSRQVELTGSLRDNGKRKYATGGTVVAEVKPSDGGGFKLRTPEGTLLWKVKIADEKIKISDNEENRNPWVLSSKHENRVKILDPHEVEIGAVKFYPDRSRAEVKDVSNVELFRSNTDRESAAYGVLMMTSIPLRDRTIIMAEILARGR